MKPPNLRRDFRRAHESPATARVLGTRFYLAVTNLSTVTVRHSHNPTASAYFAQVRVYGGFGRGGFSKLALTSDGPLTAKPRSRPANILDKTFDTFFDGRPLPFPLSPPDVREGADVLLYPGEGRVQ